ncbi:MAG: TatD family hydrolase [Candidatus Vogelbacteria bacterium]|nr:TatD family hydrolase [Candidatus Vogelbacteria bacterium]
MTPKFFDAHTHLNMQFEQDWQEVGKRTIENGTWFVNVGADEKSSELALEQAKELGELARRSLGEVGGCWATVGIHPTEGGDSDFAVIAKLAKDDKVVAIGECGLEYYKNQKSKIKNQNNNAKLKIEEIKEKQKELFRKHIELAIEVGKPLMIHCRASEKSTDAYDDCYEILKEYKNKVGDKLQFDMHFFTSDWPTAQKFLDLGGYLSFPGVITFTDQYDEIVKNALLDRIMSETDAPFATPAPHRGERNEPAYVQFVAEKIACLRSQAELRPEPREEVLTALVENAKRFYNLPLF